MDPRQIVADERLRFICVYCGGAPDTRDHVPSKVLLDEPFPTDLPVVECELIDRRCFRTQAEARLAIFRFIEGWYNTHRRHSALGQQSPINYERLMLETA